MQSDLRYTMAEMLFKIKKKNLICGHLGYFHQLLAKRHNFGPVQIERLADNNIDLCDLKLDFVFFGYVENMIGKGKNITDNCFPPFKNKFHAHLNCIQLCRLQMLSILKGLIYCRLVEICIQNACLRRIFFSFLSHMWSFEDPSGGKRDLKTM